VERRITEKFQSVVIVTIHFAVEDKEFYQVVLCSNHTKAMIRA
jgi:hypothetical protein